MSSSDYSFSGRYFPTVFAGKFAPAKEINVGTTAGGVVTVAEIVVSADWLGQLLKNTLLGVAIIRLEGGW